MKPPFTYFGGKTSIAERIAALLPPHEHYLTQGRGGQMRRTGWRFYQDPRGSHSSMPEYLAAYVSRLYPAAQRLASVSLECAPAAEVIRGYGRHPQTLIYADPPYPGNLRTLNHGRSRGPDYAHDLRTEDEHRELLEALLGCRAAVVLSGYASPLYDELLRAWSRLEIVTQTGNGGTARARTEVLWSNRAVPAPGNALRYRGVMTATVTATRAVDSSGQRRTPVPVTWFYRAGVHRCPPPPRTTDQKTRLLRSAATRPGQPSR